MPYVISIVLALMVGGLISLGVGENPFFVYGVLLKASFGSWTDLGYTLFYTTPFIFTGLAVAIPYRVGLFNIGGEGQIYFSSIMLTCFCLLWTKPWGRSLNFISNFNGLHGDGAEGMGTEPGVGSMLLAVVVAFLGGALWAALPAMFKAWRGAHEVITTIMLNFIAISLSNYLILYVWKDPQSQSLETSLFHPAYWLSSWQVGESPLNISFLFALLAAILSWIFLEKTILGFKLKAVGSNAEAARVAGFSIKKATLLGMMIGGAFTGGVVLNELLGHAHRFKDGFSPGFGFIGIAVAFLGRTHPLGVVLAAFFFAILFKGAGDLDIETENITRDFAVVMQAIFIAAVSCEKIIKNWIERILQKKKVARGN